MDYIVSVKGVSKSYGEVQALKDVCFEVKPGEIFGLIGPDGAGKTTLFRILTTLVLADEGKAEVCGQRYAGRQDICRDVFPYTRICP